MPTRRPYSGKKIPTAATPGLPQWFLVETTVATAGSTCCPLASAWMSAAAEQNDLTHFTVNGFSAGSCTGAVIASAIRCLWPASQITARFSAIAMPKSVLAALIATAEPDRATTILSAAEDCLCDWKPTADDLTCSTIPARHACGRLCTVDG